MELQDILDAACDPDGPGATIDATIDTTIDATIDATINAAAPGGVLVYGDAGRDVGTLAFGVSHRVTDGAGEPFPVAPDTLYDVASLTKPLATAATLMKLAESELDLDAPVRPWLPELTCAEPITARQLLGHAAGFPAHIPFYEQLLAGERAGADNRREALLRMAVGAELAYPPGTRTIYSDLGYIALGFVIERITGQRLDRAASERVFAPLGMTSARFFALSDDADGRPRNPDIQALRRQVAPTEVCPYRGLVWGEVHDDNAHAGGGIHGHAGLFATAADVAIFSRAILAAASSSPSASRQTWFSPSIVRAFLGGRAAPDTTWRLGWDTPSPLPVISHAGDLWPRDGVGHLGFTGCSLWLDPARGRYVVLLTNRVHPDRGRPERIRALRRAVMDAVVRRLDTQRARE